MVTTTTTTETDTPKKPRLRVRQRAPAKWSDVVRSRPDFTATLNDATTPVASTVATAATPHSRDAQQARKRSRKPRPSRDESRRSGQTMPVTRSPPLPVLTATDTGSSSDGDRSSAEQRPLSPVHSDVVPDDPNEPSHSHRQRFTTMVQSLAQTMSRYRSSFVSPGSDTSTKIAVDWQQPSSMGRNAEAVVPLCRNREAVAAMRVSIEAFSDLFKKACGDADGPRRPLGSWKDLHGTAADVYDELNSTLATLTSEHAAPTADAEARPESAVEGMPRAPRYLSRAQVESLQPFLTNLDRKLGFAIGLLPSHDKRSHKTKTHNTVRTGFANPEAASTWSLFRHNSA